MRQTKDFQFQFKTITDSGEFEGVLSRYNVTDLGGDMVMPGAFSKTLQESGGMIPLLWAHNSAEPIGRLRLTDSPTALHAKGELVLSVGRAREAYELLKAGAVKGLSIGYRTIKSDVQEGIRKLRELQLFEGSLVAVPMLPDAQVTAVKSEDGADTEALQAFRNAERDLRSFYDRMIED